MFILNVDSFYNEKLLVLLAIGSKLIFSFGCMSMIESTAEFILLYKTTKDMNLYHCCDRCQK
jgi:hypothetical protein